VNAAPAPASRSSLDSASSMVSHSMLDALLA
jgi:hypothetical protein